MVDPRDFASFDGGSLELRLGALFGTVFGGVVLAVFEGIIALPLGAARAASLLFDSIAAGLTELIITVVGPGAAFEVAWAAANAQVISFGVLSFVVGLVVVLATMRVVAWGVGQVVE